MQRVVSTGGFKKDLAMLFLTRCFDMYLKEGGKLGFLMPFTVFKTQAGARFRDFLARKTKMHVVHDLVTLYPFEGATNRTSAIVVEKMCEVDLDRMPDNIKETCIKALEKAYEENMKGIKHIIWVNPINKPIPTDRPLEEVLGETKRYEAIMVPLKPKDPGSPWMQVTPSAINAIRKPLSGAQHYEAHEGVNVALNQVYCMQIMGKTSGGKLIITNPPEPGAKKKVKQIEAIVEPDLVYPLLRGKDVKRWYAEYKDRYVIIPHDPTTGKPYKPGDMKVKFPNTYSYLIQYKEELKKRSIKPFLSLREKIKKAKLETEKKKAEEELDKNFYIIDNIGAYTFAPYKVVWKEVSARMKAGGFHVAVIEPLDDRYLGEKPVIPDHTIVLIPVESEDEAYYLAGTLNSTVITFILQYAVVESLSNLSIPKFNPNDNLQRKICELSKNAHKLAKCIYATRKPDYCLDINVEKELRNIETELDKAVAQFLGFSESDLDELKKLMLILAGEEVPAEEEVEVPETPTVNILNTLLKPGAQSYIEVDVVNPSGEEIEFAYELPWGKGSFRLVEGRFRIDTPPLKPGKYKGVIRWVWRGEERTQEFVIEVSEPEGPKRPRTLFGL
jgi:type II restriction/modification system DNA methylase subunit YeeA